MFRKTDYENVVGRPVAMSKSMLNSIDLWNAVYVGEAPWNTTATSLGIPSGICRELADISINEMSANVTNENIDVVFQKAIRDLSENLQDGLALGSFILKPYLIGKQVGVQYINADSFCPISFDDNGIPNDIVFVERKQITDNRFYFRCERHTMTENGLQITNRAYRSGQRNRLGSPCPLTDITEWADMPSEIVFPYFKMDFGYFRTPIKNRLDGSSCGVSIFDSALELIKKADIQGKRLDWEFESGERAIHVDERALKHKNGRVSLPDKRLYRGLDLDNGSGELYKEFSPTLRQAGFIEGLESYLRQIEYNVGLAYGDLSNVNYVDKSATEIKHSKQRKYNRVSSIQSNLRDCLSDFVDAVAFYLGQFTTGYEFICTFSDSILSDEETERTQDRQDVAMGVMSLAEYRSKWYGEDIETAKANIPEPTTDIIL